MIIILRCFFIVVLASMLAVTTWASAHVPVWSIPREIGGHPWFIATLCDAYWGFLTFYAWLFYKESSAWSRVLWLIAVLLLGNIAMAVYGLCVAFRLPVVATPQDLLLRGQPVTPLVPAGLIALALSIAGGAGML